MTAHCLGVSSGARGESTGGRTPRATEVRDGQLPPELALAFAPIHKRALGLAFGTAAAVSMLAATAIHLVRSPGDPYPLLLLSEYFYGYTVSWGGLVVGLFWGLAVGFVAGWFLAFCRNLVIAVALFITRTRAELAATRDFLDHI